MNRLRTKHLPPEREAEARGKLQEWLGQVPLATARDLVDAVEWLCDVLEQFRFTKQQLDQVLRVALDDDYEELVTKHLTLRALLASVATVGNERKP